MHNSDIAKIFNDIALYLEIEKIPFKPRAYEKAAQTIDDLQEELQDIYTQGKRAALESIPGIGKGLAEKIEELLKTGQLIYYEELQKKMPVNIHELATIEGLGPQHIKILYEKLGVKNLRDLEKAIAAKKISRLPGFGEQSEKNLKQGIEFVKKSHGRFLLGYAMATISSIEQRLKNLAHVQRLTIAGSVRRKKETIGDVDIIAVAKKPKTIMDSFVHMPEVIHVYAHGETKSMIKLKNGLDVDLRVIPEKSYGAALNYFTGSKAHNIALREKAMKKELKLNEYGLFRGKKYIAGRTEEELYTALGMQYIEPEMRENWGEIELALQNKLPKLVPYNALRGDLQVQTDWTDGTASIEAMAKAAVKQGLEYIAITDHTKRLTMTRGLDEKRIQKQWKEIDRVNKRLKGATTVLKGTECDILKDGSLDLPDAILRQLDVVGISVHSHFHLPKSTQTKRIIQAMTHPSVHILFHPTGRLLHRREAYEVDMEAIINAAKKYHVILEINASPERLDLKDEYIRKAMEANIMFSIDSDAHSPTHFTNLAYGIAQARRGWATQKNIINCLSLTELLLELKKKQ
ncbi:MAG: DNA polymerase III [Candidatus Kerfeldbacteria bacterium RIFCSPHIGHO2_02_FULL_42_14]|uniref:DNA-directed DNA polymerase n=1 Tax=Candidatus Kerfeldbacteria bacterium RIFCSPHIGHO2_02_FULL_42_14 TaxID=1798540 RepID=A0A1G2ASH6_9BACT|nr:MAG: DNA polymerase III [Candidatus Kerfeldbacteria bacterium RIFCSPHIGHO2_02_FULL_42_14]OGY80600.1 MAG: DNA polymerase III [Candidatus Kerfeldbacteria bacterium RIFCSPHIGHO2_12_FULL_42_13]OGY82524.1 MAG: DNA polymerase III [Candidatus Kerfeldbacteria bacterium RIFCSPLOWO2_02_FULL_42_19]OGY87554.1 MAG: DNA polymerase III [Candidatus Kerfeldbacteria bacterium RIFCSPLOWO2_12_FULL_43_9]